MAKKPAILAIVGMVAIMVIAVVGLLVNAFSDYRRRQARLAEPRVETSLPEPAARPAPPQEAPIDPERLAVARARYGALEGWEATDAPCPRALPRPEATITRAPPDDWGVRQVVMPAPPFPIRIARQPARALLSLDEPVDEPTLVLLRTEWVEPTLDNRRLFTAGRATGRAFLRTPEDDAIVCVGEYTATNGAQVTADPSELELSQIENQLALSADLVLRERVAAYESLRAAARASAL